MTKISSGTNAVVVGTPEAGKSISMKVVKQMFAVCTSYGEVKVTSQRDAGVGH